MKRTKNDTKTKDVVEMGQDLNDVVTIDTKSIFQEIFQQQGKVLLK